MRIQPSARARGFTLIEMVVVISLILVLLSIALPMYNQSILRAKESTLKQDLFTLRHVIQQYTLDKQKAPQALEDLISAHYLKFIPKDPMTGEINWQTEEEDTILSPDQTQPGIVDVHSASNQVSSDGTTTYSSW
jgi:general secretion pathway protein G